MESERRIKRRKKKKRRIITLITVVVVCILGYLAVNNQFVKGLYYKVNDPISEKNSVMEFEEGVIADYCVFDNLLISTSKNGIYAYDLSINKVHTKHFEELSSVVANYGNIKLKACEKYIAGYDKSGRELVVFNNKKIALNIKLNSSIILAKPLNNGGVVVIAEDTSAKNQVIVYNGNGKEEFIWHSGVNNILDAAYSYETGKLAVVAADLSTGILNSKFMFFDISVAAPKSELTLEDVFVTNINYIGNTIQAVSDKGIYYFDGNGTLKNTYSFNEKMLSKYKYMNNGNLALSFASGNETVIEFVNGKGKLVGDYASDGEVIFMDSFNGNVVLCEKRSVKIITKKGFLLREISYNRDLNKAFFIGRNKIVLVGNSEIRIVN